MFFIVKTKTTTKNSNQQQRSNTTLSDDSSVVSVQDNHQSCVFKSLYAYAYVSTTLRNALYTTARIFTCRP